jgi:hypothetical protein
MTSSATIFDTPTNMAFRRLGAHEPGQNWSCFDVSIGDARKGNLLVTTIWNYHRKKDKDGRLAPTKERAVLRDRTDGTYWYWIERPTKESRPTHKAHWNRVDIAIKYGIPIVGILKDARRRNHYCSLQHLFDCGWPRYARDGKKLWLELRPRGDIGCDVGEIDIRLRTASWPSAWDADEDGLTDDAVYIAPDVVCRETALQLVMKRRGRKKFRDGLLHRYKRRCVVTGCTVVNVLEAAHIDPYRNIGHNHLDNGLILRADIHTLFDLDLLGIEPKDLNVELHPKIESEYRQFVARRLDCVGKHRPSPEALSRRYGFFRMRARKPI